MKFSQIRKNYNKSFRLFTDFLFTFVKSNYFTLILKDDEVYFLNLDTNDTEKVDFELYLGVILRFFQENGIFVNATNVKMVYSGFQILEGKLIKEEKEKKNEFKNNSEQR